MSTSVAINGLGRIGRAILKLVIDEPSFTLVAADCSGRVPRGPRVHRLRTAHPRREGVAFNPRRRCAAGCAGHRAHPVRRPDGSALRDGSVRWRRLSRVRGRRRWYTATAIGDTLPSSRCGCGTTSTPAGLRSISRAARRRAGCASTSSRPMQIRRARTSLATLASTSATGPRRARHVTPFTRSSPASPRSAPVKACARVCAVRRRTAIVAGALRHVERQRAHRPLVRRWLAGR